MQDDNTLSLQQIREFLQASDEIQFKGKGRFAIYAWVSRALGQHGYKRQGRAAKGLLRQYLAKMTGLSRTQITRLICQYGQGRELEPARYRRHRFARSIRPTSSCWQRWTKPTKRSAAQSGAGSAAGISPLQARRIRAAGEDLDGPPLAPSRPGYLQVDTAHPGDLNGVKGYPINAVDEVTPWRVAGAAATISDAWLEPVLDAFLQQFPFRVRGFHSDNGSEFLNHTVEKLLNKLLIEQTKSRPRHSNDNGLVESKNGAVIRKHMGHTHIAAPRAARIQRF
ncbi:MAG: transposase family protein [Bryobacterales bacterium]